MAKVKMPPKRPPGHERVKLLSDYIKVIYSTMFRTDKDKWSNFQVKKAVSSVSLAWVGGPEHRHIPLPVWLYFCKG
jgi:hypothetical protein